MTSTYNFSAGPSVLPVDVLKQAQEDMLNWQYSGMSNQHDFIMLFN
jgi:phosphoserine aminotransferase